MLKMLAGAGSRPSISRTSALRLLEDRDRGSGPWNCLLGSVRPCRKGSHRAAVQPALRRMLTVRDGPGTSPEASGPCMRPNPPRRRSCRRARPLLTPGASSSSLRPDLVTSSTPRSVMIRLTTPTPVSGRLHSGQDLQVDRAVLLLGRVLHDDDHALDAGDEVHRAAHALDHLAGDHPVGEVAVSRHLHGAEDRRGRCGRRGSCAKLSADEKKLEPGSVVTVCLPALIRSASTSSSVGNGPMPSRPFSDCSITSMPSGM